MYGLWYLFDLFTFYHENSTVNIPYIGSVYWVSVALLAPRPHGPELPEMEKRPKEMEKIQRIDGEETWVMKTYQILAAHRQGCGWPNQFPY